MKDTERDEPRPAGYQFSRTVTAISYSLVLMASVGANDRAHDETVGTHYAQMSPVAEYLDANVGAETALARSAAPEASPAANRIRNSLAPRNRFEMRFTDRRNRLLRLPMIS